MTHRALLAILLSGLFSVLGLGVGPPAQASTSTPPPTIVSLTFDDGFASQLKVVDLLTRHGMTATFYINSGALGWDGYLTPRQVRELYRDGHEIAGHTLSHNRLTELAPRTMRREICDDRAALLDMGLPVTSFAYPYSDYDDSVVRVVEQCGYNTARTSSGLFNSPGDCGDCPFANQLPVTDERFTVRTNETVRQGPHAVATMKANVRRAERTGGWVPLVFHRICNGCSEESITRAQFAEFLSWMANRPSTTFVQTVDQVMAGPCYPFMEDVLLRVDKDDACATRAEDDQGGGAGLAAGRSLNNAVAFTVAGIGIGQVEVIAITITTAFVLIGWYRYKTRGERAARGRR